MRKKRKSNKTRSDTSAKKRKVVARKKSKRKLVPKTRNHGRWTESQFWSFIRSALRNKSRWWLPILETKRKARRAYSGPNKRQKWEYKCNICSEWVSDKNSQVDHIRPVGSLRSASDLPDFVENLFCEIDNLQVVCTSCHDKKQRRTKKKMQQFSNLSRYDKDGKRVAVFGVQSENKPDEMEIVVFTCSKKDVFRRKFANYAFNRYKAANKKIPFKVYSGEMHPTVQTIKIDNPATPKKCFLQWCRDNYYKMGYQNLVVPEQILGVHLEKRKVNNIVVTKVLYK